MAQNSGDLLQALLDRQRREKMGAVSSAPTPVTTSMPSVAPSTPISSTPTPTIPEKVPAASSLVPPPSASNRVGQLEWKKRGITLSYQEILIAGVIVLALIGGAFYLGTRSSDLFTGSGDTTSHSSNEISKGEVPKVDTFVPTKAFTVQAISVGTTKADEQKLSEMKKFLDDNYKLYGFGIHLKDEGKYALFVGAADRKDDKSLVRLRDWLRELPGPDKASRPFKSATVRDIPRMSDK